MLLAESSQLDTIMMPRDRRPDRELYRVHYAWDPAASNTCSDPAIRAGSPDYETVSKLGQWACQTCDEHSQTLSAFQYLNWTLKSHS